MSSFFLGTDYIMSLEPHEWPFKTQSLRTWDLQGSKVKGIFTSDKQGPPSRDFVQIATITTIAL